jgi:TldD protein
MPRPATPAPPKTPEPGSTVLADVLTAELDRNFKLLQKAEPAAYFISYEVTDIEQQEMAASSGSLQSVESAHRRVLECSVRVGSPAFDNYRVVNGDRPVFSTAGELPVEDDPGAIRHAVWLQTDRAWRAAAQRYLKVRSSAQLQSDASSAPPDLSMEKPTVATKPVPPFKPAPPEWAARLRRLSNVFSEFSGVVTSNVTLSFRRELRTFVNTEGTRVQHGRTFARLAMMARAKAVDGQDLVTLDDFEAEDLAGLPKEEVLTAAVRKVGGNLARLLLVQPVDPYVGPAVLSGRAAGVFFHEIFGHRVEGHRQRDETEGQTFANSVGQKVLPDFLSVVFDPTRHEMAGTSLNGWYDFDDEGVPAQPVTVVDHGVLKTFLMSRSPLNNVPHSNGHGRRQPGYEVVSRQSNLIVESGKRVPAADLRKMLIQEIARQRKPYGLYFESVTGGYTTTRRQGLQAFTVVPLIVYRVYPDGRPDELVRGVDIVGTPLASFAKILATGDRDEVFNGYCGAESGSVPVSAVSPALLVSEIEVQRKPAQQDRPPLLPRPTELTGGGR